MKVVNGSERNALKFPCGIKPCRTPVQVDRYIDIRCDTFAIANMFCFFYCDFTLEHVTP